MNWIFLDGIPWDYDVETPLVRPLGGSQSALCYLTRALARRGHAVTTLTGTSSPRQVAGVRCLSHHNIPRDVFQTSEAVLVVLNGPADLGLQLRPILPPETPAILWTQHAHDQPAMHPLARGEAQVAWDRIVCISEWQRAMFVQQLGVASGQIEVLRNAIGPAFQGLFRNVEELQAAKAGPPKLAYTSTPFRGLEVLLNCFPAIRREHPDCRLSVFSSMLVYGTEAPQDEYRHLYAQCRSTDGIDYVGSLSQPELARQMAAVSVLAYPNTFPETCCIAALEALAAGAFVVTTELGALPETCAGFGRLVLPRPTEYVVDFIAAVCEVLAAFKSDRAAFAARQFQQAEAFDRAQTWDLRALDWERAADRWLALRRG